MASIEEIRAAIEEMVCTQGEDIGLILKDTDAPTKREEIEGKMVDVYQLPYFSELGGALIDLWRMTFPHSLNSEDDGCHEDSSTDRP